MRSDCIAAVTRAAGRPLNANELRDIEGRITKELRAMAREDRGRYTSMSPAQQHAEAATRVAKMLEEAKARATRNVAQQIIAADRNMSYVEAYGPKVGGYVNAVRRLLADNLDRKTNVRSLESRRNGIVRTAVGQLGAVAKATERYLGFWTNKAAVRDVLRELYGEDTGNGVARDAAKAWSNIAEGLRQQFNAAGGAIGKLRGWAIPQSHSQVKVANAGREAWIADVLPRLDRESYVNADGSLMNDTQLQALLAHAHESIATDGANSLVPGAQHGVGSIKNRHQDSRVLHFKDADGWMDYQQKYGERSVLETMAGHIGTMGKQIATLETFGPNAEAGFKTLLDTAYQKDATTQPLGDAKRAQKQTEIQFATSSGKAGPMVDPVLAHRFDIARTLLILPKLGSATLSAVTDAANIRMTAMANRIPSVQQWLYTLKSWTSADFRQTMRANGVAVEQVTHSLSRFGEETFGHGMPSAMANLLFKVSGLNFLDSVRRTAMGAMMMRKFGDMVSQHDTMDTLHPVDRSLLESRGVTDATWQVWKQAQLSDGLLTPSAIAQIEGLHPGRQRDAMQHLVGSVFMDEGTAVPMMKDWARATTQHRLGNPQRGTWGGELVNSVLQFKSFPIAMISNHWQRLQAMPTGAGKVAYAAGLIATSTILGAISVQLKSLASGHDPQDMTDPKFAMRALVQGGSFGLYGDLIGQALVSPYRENLVDSAGPLIGTAVQAFDLLHTGLAAVKDPNKVREFGGEATRFAKGLTPFANLWYTKMVTDHLIFQRLADYFSPGYAQRSDARSQKFYGSAAYWPTSQGAAPSELLSGKGIQSPRAPNLESAMGARQ